MKARWLGPVLTVLLAVLLAALLGRTVSPGAGIYEEPLSPWVVLAIGTFG